jgi:hypothetical protein
MPDVSANLATLGPTGWVTNANWGAINGVPIIPQSALWANRAQFQSLGRQVRFTDVGPSESGTGGGNLLYWTGVRWKPVGSNLLLDAIDTPNVAAANAAEQQLNPNHVAANAGLVQDGDRLCILLTLSKNNAVETCTVRLRYGPLGTTADPVLATITTLAGASQSIGVMLEFKRTSATTLQKEGSADTSNSFGGASASAFPAAVTVSDMGTNPMFMSVTTQMSVGTEIATLQNYTLDLFATDS